MTAFRRDAILRSPDIAFSAWACVRASIAEHLAEYDADHPIGRRFPSKIIRENETSVMIEFVRGTPAGHPFSRTIICVSAELLSNKISGVIWRWLQNLPGTRNSERTEKSLEFIPSGYDPISLTIGAKRVSPEEAVEILLDDLLPVVL